MRHSISGRRVSDHNYAIVLHYLGFVPSEIRRILKEDGYTLWSLISTGEPITDDTAMLEIVKLIEKGEPSFHSRIIDFLEVNARAAGVSNEVKGLLKKIKGGKNHGHI